MSKILRRPMFRGGGKVSSYGNGIATGLADGGMPDKRGLVDGPGGYAGVSTTEGFKKSPAYKGFGALSDYILSPFANQFNQNYVRPFTGLFGYGDFPPTAATPYNTKDFQRKKNQTMDYSGILDSGAIPKAILENEKMPEPKGRNLPDGRSEADILKELMGDPKTSKEKVAEYTELFKDALGGGKKAKIQDASNMALSFAGKALKEGATVKSSFADFFEEESKRPSRSQKVNDAAAQAAIQAYLTGEQDYNAMMKQMKLIDYKTDKAVESAKSNQTLDTLLETYAGNNGDRTDEGVMQAAFNQLYRGAEGFTGFKGKLPELQENLEVGSIYYSDDPENTRTKIIFLIEADGTPKEINRILK